MPVITGAFGELTVGTSFLLRSLALPHLLCEGCGVVCGKAQLKPDEVCVTKSPPLMLLVANRRLERRSMR
jgi:hypothetical protein